MRLYFVNRFFHPDHSATSQMLSDLAFALAARGHMITVITSRLSYDDARVRLPAREVARNVEVIRVATTGFGRSDLAGRFADYATFMLAATWALLWRLRRGDVVVSKTDPPLLSILTTPIARLRGAHAVNWLQDIYPEVVAAMGMARGKLPRLGLNVMRRLRDRALRKASLNIALGERMAAVIARRGVASDQIRVIPNWADGELVKPVARERNALRRDCGLEHAFVVGYSGNLGRAHDTATILSAMEICTANDIAIDAVASAGREVRMGTTSERAIRWLFVGGGAQLGNLKDKTEGRGKRSVIFRPYQAREWLSESLSAPDVHLITLRPALEGLIVPSKYYGVAAAGRPAIFIGDPNGEIGRILRDSDTGIVVAEGDGVALAQAIRALADDPERCDAMGRRARALFDERYDLARAVNAWEGAIRQFYRV